LVAIFSVLLLASCDFLFNFDNKTNEDNSPISENLSPGQFYAKNLLSDKFYIVDAEPLASGDKCDIWVEKGSGVTQATAKKIAKEYDDTIYQLIINYFGIKNINQITSDGTNIGNIMDYADWLGDGNGKLAILLLDIKDGAKSERDAYTAGYFWSGNFYAKGKIPNSNSYSNGIDMLYIDTFPAKPGSKESYATFAHELTHMVNFAANSYMEKSYKDIWIDEGLAVQAEYLYLQEHPEERYKWFSLDPAGTIAQGNNFFVWGNYSGNSIMDEYATAYLFFQWLYLQSGKDPSIFYNIITSDYADYRAVTGEAKKINPNWSNWEVLLRTWMAANYNPTNGTYGYKDDTVLRGITAHNTGGNKISLYAGEGVYSRINTNYNKISSSGSGAHVKYAAISTTGVTPVTVSGTISGNALLTFNIDTDDKAKALETGYLTGAPASLTSDTRSLAGYSGPMIIDARDMVVRNHETELFKALWTKLQNAKK
jgi:hypothetical protein